MSTTPITIPPTDAQLRTLPNGLEIIVKEDHSAPVVSVQAWVRTGSCFEAEFLGAGISHLVEHMVFKGTASKGPAEQARQVQAIGGYLNAYTSFDRTVYYIDAPAEGFDTVLDVLSDLVAGAAFPEAEFEKEKDVIRREIDMGEDDPDTKHSHLLFETTFRTHPMGQPIIGHLDLFNRITHPQMVGYYRRHYVPDNMFFVVAGPVSADGVERKLARRMGSVPRGGGAPVLVPTEPDQLGRREAHVEFSTELTKLTLAWRIPGLTHPDIPALEVLAEILGQGRSSRLYRRLRDEQALTHSIGASCYAPPPGGIFAISGELDFDKRDAMRAEALAMVHALQSDGVTASEVGKAQRMVLGEQLEGLTSMRGLAGDLGGNWHVARNLNFTRDMVAAIEAVTPDDVQRVAARHLRDQSLTVTSINPRGALAKAARRRRGAARHEVQRVVLPNGLTILVKEDRRVPLITLHACLRGGILAESAETAGLSRLMARTMLKGTTTRTAEQISTLIEEAGGGISAESGGSSWSVTVDLLKPDLAMGLEVLADVLFNASYPEPEVKREKGVQLAAIKAEADRLTNVAFRELRETLFGPHPFAWDRNGSPKTLAGMNRESLVAFHRKLTVGKNMVLAVYGDVEKGEVVSAVQRAFASLPAGRRHVTPARVGFATSLAGRMVREVRKDKKQAVLAVGYPTVTALHRDRAALELLDESCSDMASRLFLRIREEQGLAYYTGAFQILGMAPGAFAFYLGTSPAQLEHAQAELLDEIGKLAAHGLEADELERVKRSWVGKNLISRQSPESLARTAALDELYGVGHDHHDKLVARVQSLTPGDVRAAAKRYFGPDRPHVVVRVTP
ncbi:MAG: M16 family metallopeptidase [Verrucomicrobiales bacterium]